MAITDKKTGPWGLDQVYNKINQGSIWEYSGVKGLWSMGYNSQGQQGQNSPTAYYSSPTQVGSESFVHVSKGYVEARHYVAVTSDGEMWSWGGNDYGQCGQNNDVPGGISSPIQIGSDTTWNHGSHGDNRSLAVKTDGTLWSWGYNAQGALGHNNLTSYSSPVQIPGTTWATAYGSLYSSLNVQSAIKTDGTLWIWGYNTAQGILGQNYTSNARRSSPTQIASPSWNVPGTAPSSTTWKQIDLAPSNRAGAISTDGKLWSWGYNDNGELGHNDRTNRSAPIQVGTDTTWATVALGRWTTYGTKTDGTLWAWGKNEFGQLAHNTDGMSAVSSPTQIPGTTWTTNPALINGEDRFALCAKTDGTIWAWGSGNQGMLGQNNRTSYSSPMQIGAGSWDPTSVSGNVYASSFTGQL